MSRHSAEKDAPFGGRRLCAHADGDGRDMHWLEPGEMCPPKSPVDEDYDTAPDLPALLAGARKATSVESPRVEVQWAVDLGFAITRARDESHARQWVKGYEDNPDAVTEGDPMPVVVRRTVTTTPWTRVVPSEECICIGVAGRRVPSTRCPRHATADADHARAVPPASLPRPPRPPATSLACDCATWGEKTCPRHGEQACVLPPAETDGAS